MADGDDSSTGLERAILSQPDELARVSRMNIDTLVERLQRCRRLWLVGTGSSQHAAELGTAMLHEAGRGAHFMPSMHFVHWAPYVDPHDGVIIITHTAETAYALTARFQSLDAGVKVVSITRRGVGFPDAIETVDKEASETYTVSYTASLLILARIAGRMGADPFSAEAIEAVPDAVADALAVPGIDEVTLPDRVLVYAGAGPASITAREAALKVREGARVLSEGYDIEYLLHGSAVPLTPEDRIVLLSPPDDPDGFLTAFASAAMSEGIAVTDVRESSGLPTLLAQIPLTVRTQLIALHMAMARGQNPDVVITGAWGSPGLWAIGAPEGATAYSPPGGPDA